MIRYQLECEQGHQFDGWFRSSDGFEAMRDAKQVSCTNCGSTQVTKSLMAPAVSSPAPATKPSGESEALSKLREHVEKNSDYVGLRFVDEARAMHDGDKPSRAIHGEARPDEARKLIEDGIPVAPLPFIPRQKTN